MEPEYRQINKMLKMLLLIGAALWVISFYLYTNSLRDASRALLKQGPPIHETMGWR
jgi:type VI protein secretion system component VasF